MSVALHQELGDPRTVLYKLTVKQYHEMIAKGLLAEGEPYELLDGNVVRKDRSHAGDDPMTVGHENAFVVMKLNELNARLRKMGFHLRPQQPLSLPPDDEPEPDAAIVRGKPADYADHHPTATDVVCVIEAADSSLRRDRTTKLEIYQSAGIGRSVIINLPDRVVEIYLRTNSAKGRFAKPVILTATQNMELLESEGKHLSVPVRSLLP